MIKPGINQIYMIKKSAEGIIVSFRLETDQGVQPGMKLPVVNEDAIKVGVVEVTVITDTYSEAKVLGESRIELGYLVSMPDSAMR
jgi:hypothetical protein